MMKEMQELRPLTVDDLKKWRRKFARQVKNLSGEDLRNRLRWAEYKELEVQGWSSMPAAAMIMGGFGFYPDLAGKLKLKVPPW